MPRQIPPQPGRGSGIVAKGEVELMVQTSDHVKTARDRRATRRH
jgi:hypothetical protein